MIETPPTLVSPIFPKAVWTTKKPPGTHSYTSLVRIGTDGMSAVATVAPSLIQLPIRTASAWWRPSRTGGGRSVFSLPAATVATRADPAELSDIGTPQEGCCATIHPRVGAVTTFLTSGVPDRGVAESGAPRSR